MAVLTRQEYVTQVRQDLAAEGVSQVWIRRSFEYALATVVGTALWLWYSTVDGLAKQANPATATGIFLDAWARVFGLERRAAGTATGQAILTGVPGATQPAGSVLVTEDGYTVTLDEAATVVGEGEEGLIAVNVTASDAGEDYNTDILAPLTVASPAVGINTAATAGLGGITGGQTAESDDDLRGRMLTRIRRPSGSGTAEDWIRWTKEASTAVYRVWHYGRGREGTVAGETLILFIVTGSDPIPSAGQVSTVETALASYVISGQDLTVDGPTGQATALTIALDPSYDTAANRTLVQGYIRDHFLSGASPGVTMRNENLATGIARAGIAYQLQSVAGGAGTDDIVPASLLHLPTLGTITWGAWE